MLNTKDVLVLFKQKLHKKIQVTLYNCLDFVLCTYFSTISSTIIAYRTKCDRWH